MAKIKVNVVIAGRTYPLSVENTDEEQGMRSAAKNINESIKVLQDNYAVKDMQDLLAMTCLQISTKSEHTVPEPDYSEIEEELGQLNQKIDSYLSE